MRVIFVGLHNKPHMRPLDINTKTGKLLQRIVNGLQGCEIVKTNLFDTDYLPHTNDCYALSLEWLDRVDYGTKDIIVLLGAFVHKNFPDIPCKILKVAHPGSKRSHEEMNEYVERVTDLIIKSISKHEIGSN